MDNEILNDAEMQAEQPSVEDPVEETPVEEQATVEVSVTEEDTADDQASFEEEPQEVVEQKKFDIKALIKKWWFWAIVAALVAGIVIAIVASSGSSSSGGGGGSSYVPSVSPYVQMVKGATNSNYNITYGAAFEDFFSNTSWRYFKADTGEDVVEFEGDFYYDNAPATAKIQFVLDLSAGTMQVYHLSINGEAQSKLMLATMIKKVFESY